MALWVSLNCQQEGCVLQAGRAGVRRPLLALEGLRNPWLMPGDGGAPTHAAFRPGSPDTRATVASLCTAGYAERCSHDSDCRKAHRDLRCRSEGGVAARCTCRNKGSRWDETSNRCL